MLKVEITASFAGCDWGVEIADALRRLANVLESRDEAPDVEVVGRILDDTGEQIGTYTCGP